MTVRECVLLHRGKGVKLTPQRIEMIRAAYILHPDTCDVARACGVHTTTVQRHTKDLR